MNGRDFLATARSLGAMTDEAAWRSAVSRAYYAAFHAARDFFEQLGFAVPRGDQGHAYLWLRLQNSGDAATTTAGRTLQDLRGQRNRSDYDAHLIVSQMDGALAIGRAVRCVQALDTVAAGPNVAQITDNMKAYERDVLRDVTWRP